MKDDYNLQRFVDAQAGVFEGACAELRRGRKTGHWMWFIFPQLRGLGFSSMAEYYGITSLAEAKWYLEHPLLGERLIECSRIVTLIEGRSLREIFGSPDDMKFKSSMTLFARAAPENPIFIAAIDKFCGGQFDSLTLDLLRSS
jgi:uncharacterized protein (DUF1810 family)